MNPFKSKSIIGGIAAVALFVSGTSSILAEPPTVAVANVGGATNAVQSASLPSVLYAAAIVVTVVALAASSAEVTTTTVVVEAKNDVPLTPLQKAQLAKANF
jgi:hypothetical protein